MIRVEDLSFAYAAAEREAVRKLTFDIASGEIFGFLGPSGAGKSTTQKVLIGLLDGYRGSIRVFDRDLADWGSDYYERIGVSFEFPNHYLKLTATENLDYFGALYDRPTHAAEELLDLVGLGGEGDLPVGQYSKGMKTRLGVVRALLHDPELLFLDEPTAGLDPVNARRIVELIRVQRDAGRTVFLTTHDMGVADELCDRVAFIVDGRIALIDAPRALKLRRGERKVRVEFRRGERLEREEFSLEGLGEDERFTALLRREDVQTLHTQEASLADIFIEVTGRGLS